jgi:hypothetical protein
MTLAGDGQWSARVWMKIAPRQYQAHWCETVRGVTEHFRISYNPRLLPDPPPNPHLVRTISAWGERAQADLARLHIGIVGLGSVGSMVAEAIARMGVVRLSLFDFDSVERHNLDRCLHARVEDIGRAKAAVVAAAVSGNATAAAPDIQHREVSVAEEEGYRCALDCDVLFCCVDRPWGRQVLNHIAYAHLIPVVDGGIDVRTRPSGMRGAHWRAHIAAPGRRCLECLGQYDPGMVEADRLGHLDDATYIDKLPSNHPLRRNENVFPFSMNVASFEVLQFVRMIIAPAGLANVGRDDYQFALGVHQRLLDTCESTCWYSTGYLAQGENVGFTPYAPHPAAAAARARRQQSAQPVGME